MNKKKCLRNNSEALGRGRGIRTPGRLPYNGFQDRRFRPLSHPSVRIVVQSCKATFKLAILQRKIFLIKMQYADCQIKNNSFRQILPNLPEMFKFVAIINLSNTDKPDYGKNQSRH